MVVVGYDGFYVDFCGWDFVGGGIVGVVMLFNEKWFVMVCFVLLVFFEVNFC